MKNKERFSGVAFIYCNYWNMLSLASVNKVNIPFKTLPDSMQQCDQNWRWTQFHLISFFIVDGHRRQQNRYPDQYHCPLPHPLPFPGRHLLSPHRFLLSLLLTPQSHFSSYPASTAWGRIHWALGTDYAASVGCVWSVPVSTDKWLSTVLWRLQDEGECNRCLRTGRLRK